MPDPDRTPETTPAPAPPVQAPPTPAPTAEPAPNSTYEGDADAEQACRDIVNGGSPSAGALIQAMHRLTQAQRTNLQNDAEFMKKVCTWASADDVWAVGQALYLEPKWLIYYYACKSSGTNPDVIKRAIGLGNLQKRLEIVGWQEVCEKIRSILPTEHPDNVFGEDFGALFAEEAKVKEGWERTPWVMRWRDETAKIDLNHHYTFIQSSQEMLSWAQQSPQNIWDWIVQWSPRGMALNAVGRNALDRCALEFTDGWTVPNIMKAFEIRFAFPLVAGSSMGEADFTYDLPHIKASWAQLKNLPPEQVTSQTIRRMSIYANASGTTGGGWHAWLLSGTGHGDMAIGQDNQATPDFTYFQGTIRHEVGHSVDIQVGGFENFSSKSPAKWKRYGNLEAFLDDFIRHAAGGDATLKNAARDYMNSTTDETAWNAAVDTADTGGKLTAPKASVKAALPNVLNGGDVVDKPEFNVNGRKFLRKYSGTEWQSYETTGEESSQIDPYAFNAYPEYFAEVYRIWFNGTPPDYDRGKNLPGWVESSAFPRLVSGHEVNPEKGEPIGATEAIGGPGGPTGTRMPSGGGGH